MVVLDFLTFLMYHRMATGAPTAYTVLYSRHSCCEEARRRGPLCRCPLLRTTGPSRSCEKTGQRNPDIGPREPVEKYPARGWRVSRRGPDEGRWRAAWRGARSRAALHRENLVPCVLTLDSGLPEMLLVLLDWSPRDCINNWLLMKRR
ncbi:uncharacterized protein [Ambystoma mexicanum]|uniref:uncharacterized protein isoform X2 n=1 Tax=Ambystoma mexicanum TaxID=8296 RepID=UPI0037E76133